MPASAKSADQIEYRRLQFVFYSDSFKKYSFCRFQTLNMLKHKHEKSLIMKITKFQSDLKMRQNQKLQSLLRTLKKSFVYRELLNNLQILKERCKP